MFASRKKDSPQIIADRIVQALAAMTEAVSSMEAELNQIESSRAAVIKRYVASLERAKSIMLGE